MDRDPCVGLGSYADGAGPCKKIPTCSLWPPSIRAHAPTHAHCACTTSVHDTVPLGTIFLRSRPSSARARAVPLVDVPARQHVELRNPATSTNWHVNEPASKSRLVGAGSLVPATQPPPTRPPSKQGRLSMPPRSTSRHRRAGINQQASTSRPFDASLSMPASFLSGVACKPRAPSYLVESSMGIVCCMSTWHHAGAPWNQFWLQTWAIGMLTALSSPHTCAFAAPQLHQVLVLVACA